MPKLDLKRFAKCLLNLSLTAQVKLNEIDFANVKPLQADFLEENIKRTQTLRHIASYELGLEVLTKETEFEIKSLQLSLHLLHQSKSIFQDELDKIEAQNIFFFLHCSSRYSSQLNCTIQIDHLVD